MKNYGTDWHSEGKGVGRIRIGTSAEQDAVLRHVGGVNGGAARGRAVGARREVGEARNGGLGNANRANGSGGRKFGDKEAISDAEEIARRGNGNLPERRQGGTRRPSLRVTSPKPGSGASGHSDGFDASEDDVSSLVVSEQNDQQSLRPHAYNGTATRSCRGQADIVRSSSQRTAIRRRHLEHGRRRSTAGGDIRYYTTLRTRDGDGRIRYDRTSLRSASSCRSLSIFSGLLRHMSTTFIYESDPFEGALAKCPKVALAVVERATTPVSIEIHFGTPQKQTLPSYYYVNTERHSARSRRAAPSGSGSRASRSNSAQSASLGDRSLPSVDSPRPSFPDLSRRGLRDDIPEENDGGSVQPSDVRATKSANSVTGNALRSQMEKQQGTATKRPVTSSSISTARSLGLPGRTMRS